MSRSLSSKLAEIILTKTKPKYMTSKEDVDLFLRDKTDTEAKSIFKSEYLNDMKVISLKNKENKSKAILYIHGGAYVNQLNIQHTTYAYILNKMLKMSVYLPAYPLAPKHDYKESYELITSLYRKLLTEYDDIVIMGDSAGGGFSLAFCQYLNSIGIRQPSNIIVISPWVDLTMNKCGNDANDPILGKIGLEEIAKSWANEGDTEDYMLSPYYGDNHNLAKTLIIAGTNEIFYPSIREYYEKLVDDGVEARLIVGEDLFHIYPLFPIKEAINILKEIKKEIDN